ncbi:MAG: aminotransferase class V-fold PLP-dependent enzyme [Leptospiraceae bacterium]|nr:aminotransferase class V-fold PLP-dependent enzyme [Leptospiraceae bacterium]
MTAKSVYFDNNSTHAPIQDIITNSFKEYFENYYNPSGATKFSLACQSRIELARSYFSAITGKNQRGLIFTSTGTESNYLLVSALAETLSSKKIITSTLEHPSAYAAMESYGFEVILIKTDKTGRIDLNDLETKLKIHNSPVFLIYASNETGVIQPVKEAQMLAKKFGTFLFSDLMQAFGKTEIDFSALSGFSFSGHKIGAGMGSSIAYIDPELAKNKDFSIFRGGNQENGLRAGTENLQSIIAFHKSSEFQLTHLAEKNKKLSGFQKKIETELKGLGAIIVSENSTRLSSTTFAILPIADIDFFMIGIEDKNIVISNGASCKSRTRTPSGTLLSMGYAKEEALRAVRISSGFFTTEAEVNLLIDSAKEILKKLK